MMKYFLFVAVLFLAYLLIKKLWFGDQWVLPKTPFPEHWRKLLQQKVNFYNSLSAEEKERFEYKVQEFLLNCKITGVQVPVDDTARLLVAASAVIPVFGFPNWRYVNIYEVLLYPGMFNPQYQVNQLDSHILGMVGTGAMEGKMILSLPALYEGFSNASDKKNTAIHEFVHLIDKTDGVVDGIPSVLTDKQYAVPWMNLIHKKLAEMQQGDSDINPYGATNESEFFAVISEYFFERPQLLAEKHPEVYRFLEQLFNHRMASRKLMRQKVAIGRNDPCPCNSGKKFKKCCGRKF